MTSKEIFDALADPFPEESVSFRAGATKGNRCLALAYIDARDVMGRLDQVLGQGNWEDAYHWREHCVLCRLSLRIEGEWITKEDVGGESEQKDPGDRAKASVSDALKRAAVKWGVGRYLYSLENMWCEYDPTTKQIVKPPKLPARAVPARRPAKPSAVVAPATPTAKSDALEKLEKAAGLGTTALEEAWKSLSAEARRACQGPVMDDLFSCAQEVDRSVADAVAAS